MDEKHTTVRAVDIIGTRPQTPEPFDPAALLAGRQPPPPAYVPGPTVEVAQEFDPATFLGARALRGAFNLATVKPLVATIGGVEMVTVPASAYVHALRQVAAQELPVEAVEQAGPVLDAAGMLDLLLSLYAAGAVKVDQLVKATGSDHLAISDRVIDYAAQRTLAAPARFVPSPEAARFDVTDGKAGMNAPEAHGSAPDASKSERHSRKGGTNREVP